MSADSVNRRPVIAGGFLAALLALCGFHALAQQVPARNELPFPAHANARLRVNTAPEWAQMLKRDSGWIGADGIYCVPLNGVEAPGKVQAKDTTLFWFSDDVWGKVQGDTLADGWELAHNAVGYMVGSDPDASGTQFYRPFDKEGHTLSIFEPRTPASRPGDYYWLGDGFFNHALDSTIYLFAYRIRNVPGGIFPFEDVGVSLIALPRGSRPPFTGQRQIDTPLFKKNSGGKGKLVFGICVLANTTGAGAPHPDGYIYVYGVRGPQKELVVARVADNKFEDFSAWRYWDGQDWSRKMDKAAALTDHISNEMSVSFMEDGRVLAVYQQDGTKPDIMIQAGQSPWGPFQLPKKIWSTPEIYDDLDFYTYNAKAHPHLSKSGTLLVSYNVNSFDFLQDIKEQPWHLRPRFITIQYK